jgi:hypothetical protein
LANALKSDVIVSFKEKMQKLQNDLNSLFDIGKKYDRDVKIELDTLERVLLFIKSF